MPDDSDAQSLLGSPVHIGCQFIVQLLQETSVGLRFLWCVLLSLGAGTASAQEIKGAPHDRSSLELCLDFEEGSSTPLQTASASLANAQALLMANLADVQRVEVDTHYSQPLRPFPPFSKFDDPTAARVDLAWKRAYVTQSLLRTDIARASPVTVQAHVPIPGYDACRDVRLSFVLKANSFACLGKERCRVTCNPSSCEPQ